MSWGWREIPIGPPPGIALIDKLVDHFEPTPQELKRRAALKFIADNPNHPAVLAYKAALAAEEKAKADAEKGK
jgi:hypothetical protein